MRAICIGYDRTIHAKKCSFFYARTQRQDKRRNTKEATIRNSFHTYANIKQFASAQNDTQKANYILKTLSLSTQKPGRHILFVFLFRFLVSSN